MPRTEETYTILRVKIADLSYNVKDRGYSYNVKQRLLIKSKTGVNYNVKNRGNL